MYKKIMETKVIRTRHIISFGIKTRVIDLIQNLQNVPLEAKVTDFSTNEDTGNGEIEFEDEKEEGCHN